jgi:cobalt-zinc-cadmium efflux system protein
MDLARARGCALRTPRGNRELSMHMHAHSHSHDRAHAHEHNQDEHHRALGKRRLQIVLGITLLFTVAEFAGGWISNSLALIADAAHMLADAGALSLSLFALWFARRPATDAKTFGYLRLEILAALANGVTLIVIAILIFIEAVRRLQHPEGIESRLMLAVAAAGFLANLASAFVLHRSSEHSLNIRGAYLHVLSDMAGSAGAIAAALVILLTGWLPADAIISCIVGLLILVSSWRLLRESVDILLEAVPAHIDIATVRNAIQEIPGVDDVHDLHVWTVTSGFLAMSGHAVVQNLEHHQRILEEIHRRMRENFGIRHATIQLERAMYNIEQRLPRS